MDVDAVAGLRPEEAVNRLLPEIAREVRRIRPFAEKPENHLRIGPGWLEEAKKVGWPGRYEGRVGNVIFTFAIEDRTQYGPHDLRFKAKTLSISYIDVKEAELRSTMADMNVPTPEVLPGKQMHVPWTIARVIANGFFEGEEGTLHESLNKDTGDWAYFQIEGQEEEGKTPFPKYVVPA